MIDRILNKFKQFIEKNADGSICLKMEPDLSIDVKQIVGYGAVLQLTLVEMQNINDDVIFSRLMAGNLLGIENGQTVLFFNEIGKSVGIRMNLEKELSDSELEQRLEQFANYAEGWSIEIKQMTQKAEQNK